jgi:ankyrin repeat protein
LLIAAGASLDFKSKYQKTALLYVVERGLTEFAKLLIAAGASLD